LSFFILTISENPFDVKTNLEFPNSVNFHFSFWYMAANTDRSSDGVVITGIPVEILDSEVDTKLLCTVCKLLPRNPYQGSCGHRFCSNCIAHKLSRFVVC